MPPSPIITYTSNACDETHGITSGESESTDYARNVHTRPNVAYCIIYDYSNTMVRRQYYCGAEVKRKRKTITEMCTGYNMIHNKLLQFLGPSVRLPPSAAAELQMSTRRIMRGTLYVY